MSLRSLLYSTDDKICRMLTRVLGDLEIAVDRFADVDLAIRKLRKQCFETVVVDCAEQAAASRVLKSARRAPCNARAVAVGIVDGSISLRSAFDLGAHMVLYKPLSPERAKSSFRAARALMKCERRRQARIALEIPVSLIMSDGSGQCRTTTIDVGEGGMAIQLAGVPRSSPRVQAKFVLPESECRIECAGEIAWENGRQQAGIRFLDMGAEPKRAMAEWLSRHTAMEENDPPLSAIVTDVSDDACYVETPSPFPVYTRVAVAAAIGAPAVRCEALVKVMHPETGMALGWRVRTPAQKLTVAIMVEALRRMGRGARVLVEPESLESEPAAGCGEASLLPPSHLLSLIEDGRDLTQHEFLLRLQQLRTAACC